MIEAVIFDMDGVLVDSEPLWREAEIEVFARCGLSLREEECAETMGLRLDEVVRFRLGSRTDVDFSLVEHEILDAVVTRVSARAEAKAGAHHAVDFVRARGLRLGLASSSPLRLIVATLERIGLADRFEVVHSAEGERAGKPHPAVYLTAAARLGVAPARCLAIEDSLRGVASAKAASMSCIAVPEAPDPQFAVADLVLGSLLELNEATWAAIDR